jgi:hypothetical protein
MSSVFESIVSAFHLPPSNLHHLLTTNDTIMAGPAALTGYLQQNGKIGFDAPRMDIWINGRHPHWMQPLLATQPQLSAHHRFTTFLEKNNYINMEKLHVLLQGEAKPIRDASDGITLILNFCHPLGKVVRLLFTVNECVNPYTIIKRAEFNIDNCWYNHNTDDFHAYSPSTILRKQIYACPHDEFIPSMNSLTQCQHIRLQFYLRVGFILGEDECKVMEKRDPRDMTNSILHGIKAFDVCAYEEVDAVNFLDTSYWNILIKTGDQFQAFDRATLYDYMKNHRSHVTIGDDNTIIYDTPHHQSIPRKAIVMFLWSDYSIVELIPCTTIYIAGQPKSIMNVNFYTVAQWNEGVPGYSVSQ